MSTFRVKFIKPLVVGSIVTMSHRRSVQQLVCTLNSALYEYRVHQKKLRADKRLVWVDVTGYFESECAELVMDRRHGQWRKRTDIEEGPALPWPSPVLKSMSDFLSHSGVELATTEDLAELGRL